MATECKTKSNDTDSKVQRKKEQLTKYKKEKGKTKRKKENYHWKLQQQPTDFSTNSRAPE
jgi:hypothetical protein